MIVSTADAAVAIIYDEVGHVAIRFHEFGCCLEGQDSFVACTSIAIGRSVGLVPLQEDAGFATLSNGPVFGWGCHSYVYAARVYVYASDIRVCVPYTSIS